jgi:hypothetical protein
VAGSEKIIADELIRTFSAIPAWLEVTPSLVSRGRSLDCDCRLGLTDHPFFEGAVMPRQGARA